MYRSGSNTIARTLAFLTGGLVLLIGVNAYAKTINDDEARDQPEPEEPDPDPADAAEPPSAGGSVPPAAVAPVATKLTKDTKLSKHFTYGEFWQKANPKLGSFASKSVPYPPEWIQDRLMPLIGILEQLRVALGGAAIRINSAYRSPKYNAAIGGASRSQHKEGRAVDIVVKGHSPAQVRTMIRKLHDAGKIRVGAVGIYPTFVHLDTRPSHDGKIAIFKGG
jgi:uncharacterized protein YcbK (DUF882 family)